MFLFTQSGYGGIDILRGQAVSSEEVSFGVSLLFGERATKFRRQEIVWKIKQKS